MKSSSVSWVYIEVLLNPAAENPQKIDIIQFYNKVFLDRMKVYILETKKIKLEQGSKTPILNKSNFMALLTPGGRRQQPGIANFCALTPLVDSVSRKSRTDRTIYQNHPSQAYRGNAGVLATPNSYVQQTPRTQQLYAHREPTITGTNLNFNVHNQ